MFKIQCLKFKVAALLVLSVPFVAWSQIPTNNIAPATLHVITDTNGTLIAPTNFWTRNQSNINSVVTNSGGMGFANTNLVPAGATYTTLNNVDGFSYVYVLKGLTPGLTYPYWMPDGGDTTNFAIVFPTNTQDVSISGTNGTFTPTTSSVYLLGYTQNQTVTTIIGPAFANEVNYYGPSYASGAFNLGPLSLVDPAALPGTVPLYNSFWTFSTQVQGHGVKMDFISTNNSPYSDGSLMDIYHYGSHGYADIGFFTHADETPFGLNWQNKASYTLQAAIGVADGSSTLFPYTAGLYIELYNVNMGGFNWVNAGYHGYFGDGVGNGYIGGVINKKGGGSNPIYDLFWSHDGSTNNPAFYVSVSQQTISNKYHTYFASNTVAAGTAFANNLNVTNAPTLQTTNAGAGITVGTTAVKIFLSITNNGVVYKIPAY